MKKNIFIFLVFFSIIIGAVAQIPTGYYDNADGKTGATLKTALYNIIKGHTSVSYDHLWTDFQYTDKKPNGKVWDMYSNCDYTFVTNQCGSYNSECDCYNREHSFPKSWFNDASPMYSDIFHIFATDGYVNNMRGNYPFGEVNSPTKTSGNGSKLGPCAYTGYSGTVFEPVDDYKGDLARATLYMVTRYENLVAGWQGNDPNANAILNGTTYPAFESWHINMLIEWHEADPVSTKEIDRNNYIYSHMQYNRNPYIDHPEYVRMVWDPGTAITAAADNHRQQITITNKARDISILNNSDETELSVRITAISGSILTTKTIQGKENSIHLDSSIPDGVYIISVSGASITIHKKIILH